MIWLPECRDDGARPLRSQGAARRYACGELKILQVVQSLAKSDHTNRSLEKGLFTFIVAATLDPYPARSSQYRVETHSEPNNNENPCRSLLLALAVRVTR